MGQGANAILGPSSAAAYDGANQGADGIAQGHFGSMQGQATGPQQGMDRAATPGGMEGDPIVAAIKMIFEKFIPLISGGMGRP